MSSGRACGVALAYARGELQFIGEWVDYHLTLGLSQLFVGVHVNEDLVPAARHLTVKRPYAAMYEVGRSEAEVVADFLDVLEPFGDRVATYLLHREYSAEPDGYIATQERFYNAILGGRRSEFEWIAPFDIDEYLVPQPPYPSITAALDAVPTDVAGVVMEQVIATPRWDDDRRPHRGPLIVPELRRCSEVVPFGHGLKMFARCRAAASLGLHEHQLVAGSVVLGDRRLLQYHFRGFPEQTEETPYRTPVERLEFDLVDRRPWELLEDARRRADGPPGPERDDPAGRDEP